MSRVSPDSLFFPALALAPIVRRFRQQRCAQHEKNKSRLPRGGGISPGSRMPKCRLRTRGRQGICLVFGSHDMCGHNFQSSEQHGEGLWSPSRSANTPFRHKSWESEKLQGAGQPATSSEARRRRQWSTHRQPPADSAHSCQWLLRPRTV